MLKMKTKKQTPLRAISSMRFDRESPFWEKISIFQYRLPRPPVPFFHPVFPSNGERVRAAWTRKEKIARKDPLRCDDRCCGDVEVKS
jgi:hypothetical protein